MFGNKRKKATDFVVQRMRPLIGLLQWNTGVPAGFWEDDFVLGFFHLMIAFHTEQSGFRLSQSDKGFVLSDTYTALSNVNGQALARRATERVMEQPQRPDFKKGGDNAHICAFASIGKVSEDGMLAVNEAKELAASQGNGNDIGAVTGLLLQRLYFEEIEKRFNLN